jgi:hypothetical protein
VLCTGRLSLATLPFLREVDISAGFAVCSNGAVLIDAATGRVVEQVEFDLRDPIAAQWFRQCPDSLGIPRLLFAWIDHRLNSPGLTHADIGI